MRKRGLSILFVKSEQPCKHQECLLTGESQPRIGRAVVCREGVPEFGRTGIGTAVIRGVGLWRGFCSAEQRAG